MSKETLKPTGIYKADSLGRWPCPGGYCTHYKCIIEYETNYVNRRYFIGKIQD